MIADNCTMEEMLQAPTKGYGDAIVLPNILAENFEIRTSLLSLIQANQFYGFESNIPHNHIRSFNRITSTLKFRDVPNDAIKLMLFLYSLKGAAKICNTIPNPWADLKAITTRSSVTLAGPSVSPPLSTEVLREPETITNQELTESTNNVPPLVVQPSPISTIFLLFLLLRYPRFMKIDLDDKTNVLIYHKKLLEKEKEELKAKIEKWQNSSKGLDNLLDSQLSAKDKSGLGYGNQIHKGDVLYLEKLLNEDPSPNLPPVNTEDLKQVDATMTKPSIDEPPDLELKELLSHLEYIPWVSPVHCVPKNDGITVVENKDNELIPTRFMMAIFHDMIKKTMELVLSKTILYTDHSTLKYLLAKQDANSKLIRWILLLQEFDVITRDKKGAQNLAADHLSRSENPHQDELEKKEITETFPLETLGMIAFRSNSSTPWFTDFENYHAGNFIVKGTSSQITPDLEASHARSFVHRSLEFQSLAYGNLIS
nr:reverse transcriptase domain-containing protein [Tanacetum cinerariifolium]